MAKVECTVEQCELENDRGMMIPGVVVTCSKCGHFTESFGTTSRSIKRCLVLLREECPQGEKNFYVADELEDLESVESRPAPASYQKPEPISEEEYPGPDTDYVGKEIEIIEETPGFVVDINQKVADK
jgi:hypothetical protein